MGRGGLMKIRKGGKGFVCGLSKSEKGIHLKNFGNNRTHKLIFTHIRESRDLNIVKLDVFKVQNASIWDQEV